MKVSLKQIGERLRDGAGAYTTSETRRVLVPLVNDFQISLPLPSKVVPVVPFVPAYKVNDLDWNDQVGNRSFQSFQSPEDVAGDYPDALEVKAPDIQGLGDAEPSELDHSGTAWGVPQSIPHDMMLAGLRAAALIRPALVPNAPRAAEGNPDPWADGVAQLRRMMPLDGFSVAQWHQIATDAAALLTAWGNEMHQLGWSAADAFGIHPDVLGRAVRGWGLALLLDGGRVVDVTAAGATIKRLNGVQQSFTRRSGNGAVPVWEIGPARDTWAEINS